MPASSLSWLLAGLAVGAMLGWLLARLAAVGRAAAAEARAEGEAERRRGLEADLASLAERLRAADRELAVAQRNLADQQRFVELSKKELEGAFRGLADEVLQGSQRQFLGLAEQRLGRARAEAAADLEARKQAVETLLAPLTDTLGRLDRRTGELERARQDAYARLDEQVRQLAATSAELQERTTSLATALKGAPGKGRWGELALRNIAELAGMTAHCDFDEQSTVEGGGRPDMTVHLPGDRHLAIDAKAPLRAYLDASQAVEPQARERAMDEHVANLRKHVRDLAARDYATALGGAVDLVVLFLPGDPYLAAAFERAPDLQVEALREKVLIATPTTLIALLRTVAIYWQQHSLAEHAQDIATTALELYERAALLGEHLGNVGHGLGAAVDAYNAAVGSFRSRLLPMASRLEALEVVEHSKRTLEAPEPVVEAPRSLEP